MNRHAGLFALILAGCGGGGAGTTTSSPTSTTPPGEPWQRIVAFDDDTDGDGILALSVDVQPGETAFQVTASSAKEFVGVERLLDPAGNVVTDWEQWWYTDEALTDAFFGYARTVAFNWPVRAEDGPLTAGTWTVELYSADANLDPKPSRLGGKVWLKSDADFSKGEVPVHIVYAKGTETEKVTTAVEDAVVVWKRIWGDAGLTLVPTYHSSQLDKNLDFANKLHGSEEVAAYVETLTEGELVLIIGETVDNDPDTFGQAAGIPGPVAASPFTWVTVGWLTNAGVNAKFDADEIELMGETMAHEVGHFSGLYHPVDFDYDFINVESWDALADTDACTEWEGCEATLADNVMYPYPVCDYYGNGGCTAATKVTNDQGGVWHRYLGVK